MTRLRRPTLLLRPTTAPGLSKLGGEPELPNEIEWPLVADAPRAFVAQIDLGAFQPHAQFDWLPQGGTIYAFVDDQRVNPSDEVLLIYGAASHGAARAFPTLLPAKLRFRERRIGFDQYESLPSLDWLDVNPAELDVDTLGLDELAELPDRAFGDEIQHRIGGYPSEIQNDQMHVSCEYIRRGLERDWNEPVPGAILRAARDWRMILQIDSDPALGMNWGDGGRLYVFGRKQDLVKGDFSKTVTISQSH